MDVSARSMRSLMTHSCNGYVLNPDNIGPSGDCIKLNYKTSVKALSLIRGPTASELTGGQNHSYYHYPFRHINFTSWKLQENVKESKHTVSYYVRYTVYSVAVTGLFVS